MKERCEGNERTRQETVVMMHATIYPSLSRGRAFFVRWFSLTALRQLSTCTGWNNIVARTSIVSMWWCTCFALSVLFTLPASVTPRWFGTGSFPSVEGFYLPRGDSVKHIEIEINGERIRLNFSLSAMQDPAARVSVAHQFIDKYLVPLMDDHLQFNGVKDVEGTLHKAEPRKEGLRDKQDAMANDIADRILEEVSIHVQSYGLGPMAIKKRWAHGSNLIYHRGAVTVAPSLERFGEWEEHAVQLMSALLCPQDVGAPVFDVGANQGLITLALQHLHPLLEYHAFEPQRQMLNVLAGNVLLRPEANIFVHHVAVDDKRSIVQIPKLGSLHTGRFSAFGFGHNDANRLKGLGMEQVQGIRLADMVFPLDPNTTVALKCPQLVKIDVEGHEHRVIAGAEEIVRRCARPPILYFESHSGRNVSRSIELVVGRLQYDRCYYHIFPYVRSKNFMKNEEDFKMFAYTADASSNLLCVFDRGWPNCANDAPRVEHLIRTEELVLVTSATMQSPFESICNLLPGEVNDQTLAWCAKQERV